MKIAVLCVNRNSVYKNIDGLEVYDRSRDARNFKGGMAVIAHPPCRSWSVFCAHQAKPEVGERELGLWCADQVRKWGGVLEQPAKSRLWEAAKLPKPGWHDNGDGWSIEVWQAWWGYPMKKATWLFFSGVEKKDVVLPIRLHPQGGDRRAEQVMSHAKRSETIKEFGIWLVNIVQRVKE